MTSAITSGIRTAASIRVSREEQVVGHSLEAQRCGAFTKDTVRDTLANRFYLDELRLFEPLVQLRAGAAQPMIDAMSELHMTVRSGDPDGIRTHDLHRDRVA